MKEYHARPNDQDEPVMIHRIGIEMSVRTPQLKPGMGSNLGRHAFLFFDGDDGDERMAGGMTVGLFTGVSWMVFDVVERSSMTFLWRW